MADTPQDIRELSPDKLMTTFTRSPVTFCLIVATLAHLVIGAVTSLDYIRDRWIDPEGATLRKQADKEALEKAAHQAADKTATQPGATQPASQSATSPAAKEAAKEPPKESPQPSPDDPNEPTQQQKKSAVYKSVTQKARPEEIPTRPTDSGLKLE